MSGEAEQLGPGALLGTDRGVPFGAALDDPRYVAKRFDVVDYGWTAEGARDGGEGRTIARIAAFSLQGFEQAGLLTANICAGTAMGVDLDAEARAHHVRTDVAFGARLGQRRVESFLLQREFPPKINVAGVSANRAAGDQNPLD